jgi:hypothetical protein
VKSDAIMMKLIRIAVAAGGVATAPLALAADFDGSKPLICATHSAMECTPGLPCYHGAPADMGAPAFMRIDFAKKVVVGPERTTPIVAMEKSDEQLLLQGTELGFAWAIALDRASGRMVATAADRDGAFVLHGACTPL